MQTRKFWWKKVSRYRSGARVLWPLLLALAACTTPDTGQEVDPEVRALLWDVQAAIEDQAYVTALTVIDSALQQAPEWAQLHLLKGDMLTNLYRFDDAESAYQLARENAPARQGVAYVMGNNAFFVGRYRDALAYYDTERQLVSGKDTLALGSVWAQIGRVYDRLGVADSAIIAYTNALEHQTSNGQAWAWLGELYEEEGGLDEARAAAERAIEFNQEDPEFNYMMGRLNYQTGRFGEVEPYLEKTLNAEPWHVGAHYNMARMLIALDRHEEASYYLEETDRLQVLHADIILARFAVQHNPGGLEEWLVLADLYQQAGRHREWMDAIRIAGQLNR